MKVYLSTLNGEISPPELDFDEDVQVKIVDDLFSDEVSEEINSLIGQEKLVLAGESPRITEKYYTGRNIEYVNIREHVSWLNHSPQKIRSLIKGAVRKLKEAEESHGKTYNIKNKSALVIGGGVAGLEAARHIAQTGYHVYLIEKTPFLGGVVAKLDRLYPEGTANSHTLYPLINEVARNDNIEILTNTEVEEVDGEIGDYKVRVNKKGNIVKGMPEKCIEVCPVDVNDFGIQRKAIYYMPTYPESYGIDFESCTKCGNCVEVCEDISLEEKPMELNVGTIIVATGLKPYDASKIQEYGYGKLDNVYTKLEFERLYSNGMIRPDSVSIIHCAGSRDQNHLPYCSKICCMLGLKESKLIKDIEPDTDVTIHYIDMRSFGRFEEFYNKVREHHGVKFIQGRPSEVLQDEDKLIVRGEDILAGKNIEYETDAVVLMTGFVPDKETLEKLGINTRSTYPTEYVNSSHSVDSNPRGIFIAGAAAFPKGVDECIMEARDAAGSAIELMCKDEVEDTTPTAVINSDICGAIDCRICVTACPYGAVYLNDEEEVTVNEEICMGCGLCTATCAAGANQLKGYKDREILAQIESTVEEGDVLALMCKWSSYNAADKAGYEKLDYPENVKIIRMPCTGRIDAQMLLKAYASGAKSVLVAGCPPDACHYFTGNFKARKRIMAARRMLEQFGIDPGSLSLEWLGKEESKRFAEIVNKLNREEY